MAHTKVDYKKEVLNVYPNATYMYFEQSSIRHKIRDYTISGVGENIGQSIINEYFAWANAYLTLLSQGKIN